MIELERVGRDNFDFSGLSAGYEVAQTIGNIETGILQLIKGVFTGIPDRPLDDDRNGALRFELLSRVSGIEQKAVGLFANHRQSVFESFNRSLDNGFYAGVREAERQTGEKSRVSASLAGQEQGQEVIMKANGNLLSAQASAVRSAVAGVVSGIALLTGGLLAGSGMTLYEGFDRFVLPDFRQGLPGKTTRDGKQIALVGYAEGVTRESSQEALLIGESAVARESGHYLVQISAHFSCCPLCLPWQEKVLIDDKWAGGKPDGVHELISTAVAAGLFHYNCRHLKRIYIPGKSVGSNPSNYDPEKVAVNYELEQIQRRLERSIRTNKNAWTLALTNEARNKAQKKIADAQAQLRGLVNFASDNGYKVYRQNWKEQAGYVNAPKPVYGLTTNAKSDTMDIRRNQATGRASAIKVLGADLNKRQGAVLTRLTKAGDAYESTKRNVKTKDIAALTAKEGVEFALFTKGNWRMIVRGDSFGTPVGEERLKELAADGWKFSAHTHPTTGYGSLIPSSGDMKVLYLFKQGQSVIYNASGEFERFEKE